MDIQEIKDKIYDKLNNVDYEVRSDYGIIDAISDGLTEYEKTLKVNDDIVEQRCHSVLKYLYPDYKTMTTRQYNNAFESLRTIYYGTQITNSL